MNNSFGNYINKLFSEIKVKDIISKVELAQALLDNSISDKTKCSLLYTDETMESLVYGKRNLSKEAAYKIRDNFDQNKLYKFIFNGIKKRNTLLLQDNPELEDTYRTMANERVDEYIRIIYNICQIDTRYVNVFFNKYKEYHIQKIINKCDPSCGISSIQIELCSQFVECVKRYYSKDIVTSAPKELTLKYLEFAEELDSYISYLGEKMVPDTEVKNYIFDSNGQILRFKSDYDNILHYVNQWFVPRFRDENTTWAYDFKKHSDDYRTRLCNLYTEITKIRNYM